MFSAFHHLQPEDALMVLKDARDANTAIAVFDVGSARTDLKSMIQSLVFFGVFALPMNLIFFWALAPKLGPLSWQRIMFTYVIPVVPLVTAWDGFVSGLRSYTLSEMRQMTERLEGANYVWSVGELKAERIAISYIIGHPVGIGPDGS
jgi:hypothetical protein